MSKSKNENAWNDLFLIYNLLIIKVIVAIVNLFYSFERFSLKIVKNTIKYEINSV